MSGCGSGFLGVHPLVDKRVVGHVERSRVDISSVFLVIAKADGKMKQRKRIRCRQSPMRYVKDRVKYCRDSDGIGRVIYSSPRHGVLR